MRFRRGRIGNGLAVLAGARPDVLAAAPGARAKFVALGGVLLSTGGLALVSMAFAVHMALGVWWPFALLVGLGWGLVVVNLDRMLLVGMAHDSSLKRNLVLAVPRVGLALVLGVVIATPLTLQVFAKEIDTEIVTMQAEAADAYRASLADDARFAHLPELEERIATAEADRRQRGSGRRRPRGGAGRGDGSPGRARRRGRPCRASSRPRRSASSTARAAPATPGPARPTCEARAGGRRAGGGRGVGAVGAGRRRRRGVGRRGAQRLAGRRRRWTTDRAELARLTAEQDRLQAAFDATNEGVRRPADAAGGAGPAGRPERHAGGGAVHALAAVHERGDPAGAHEAAAQLQPADAPTTGWRRCATPATSRSRSWRRSRGKTVAKAKEELLVMAEKERVDRQKEAILARRRAALADLGRAQAAQAPAAGRGRRGAVAAAVGHRPDPRAGAQRRRPDGAHRAPPSRGPGADAGLTLTHGHRIRRSPPHRATRFRSRPPVRGRSLAVSTR